MSFTQRSFARRTIATVSAAAAALAVLLGPAAPATARNPEQPRAAALPKPGEELTVQLQAKATKLTLDKEYEFDLQGRLTVKIEARDATSVAARVTAFEGTGSHSELGEIKVSLTDAANVPPGVIEPDPKTPLTKFQHTLSVKFTVTIANPPSGQPGTLVTPTAWTATATGYDAFPPTTADTGYRLDGNLGQARGWTDIFSCWGPYSAVGC